MNVRRLMERTIDFLAPRHCVFCGVDCEGIEGNLCIGCLEDLPWCEPPVSPVPGKLDSVVSVLNYEFPVDVAIKAFKFQRKLYYASAFSEILLLARSIIPSDIDAVLPVPLHWWRKARRGYNQADEISGLLAKSLAVPRIRNVRRRRATPFQSGLDAAERARNLRRAFRVKGSLPYQHILIVDDVVTTGATLESIAVVLKRSGVERVSALCLARAG